MDFSTKAIEGMATILAEEMSRLIEVEAIQDGQGLENSLRQMLKEVGAMGSIREAGLSERQTQFEKTAGCFEAQSG